MRAMTPNIGMRFTALEDFWSDEVHSQYCAGMHYTIVSGALADLVAGWLAEGKVAIAHGGARMNGSG